MERTKKTFTGRVVSDKTDKTITVLIESYKVHPLYGKRVKYSKKYAAHDELNDAKVGDLVRIEECRPMSKTKKGENEKKMIFLFYLKKIIFHRFI